MIVPTCQTDDDVTWRKKMTTAINEYVGKLSKQKKKKKKKMLGKLVKKNLKHIKINVWKNVI